MSWIRIIFNYIRITGNEISNKVADLATKPNLGIIINTDARTKMTDNHEFVSFV